MSLYKAFKTDKNLETGGIVLSYGKNDRGEEMEITIARAGGSNANYTRRLEARAKPYRRQINLGTMDTKLFESIMREVYAETVVLGWRGIDDENGNPLPCTKENVVKVFEDLPDLFADVQEQANRAALFRTEIQEEGAKNS